MDFVLQPKRSGKNKIVLLFLLSSKDMIFLKNKTRTHNNLIIYVIIHGPYLNSHQQNIFFSLSFHSNVSLSFFL